MRHHDVRKVKLKRHESFEDRTWPVQVALVVLGAYVIGIIAATLRFDARNLFSSAMTWTIATVVVVALLMICAPWVNNRWFKRGLQFSLILSLIVNVSVLLVLSLMNLLPPFLPPEEVPVATVKENQQDTLPEYFPMAVDGNDRPKQEYEKPVTTGEPELEQRDLIRKTTVAVDVERPQPEAPSRPASTASRESVERAEVVESAPREYDLRSTLSRQERVAQPRVAPPVVENVPAPQRTEANQVQASPSQIQRQTPHMVRQHLDQQLQPTSQEQATRELLSHRSEAIDRPDPVEASRPTTSSRTATLAQPSRVTTATGNRPSAALETSPEAVPANSVTRRQQTTSPRLETRADVLTPEGVVQRSRSEPLRQQLSEPSPQLAETPEPLPNRRQPVTVAPSDADSLASQVVENASPDASADEAQPADTSLARQSAQQKQPMPTPGPAIESVTRTSQPPATLNRQRVVADRSTPAADDQADVQTPRRAVQRTLVAISPVPKPAEGTVKSDRPTSDPTAMPAQTAVTVSEQGVAGTGQAPNLDQADAAPRTPVTIASASARRERPSQQSRAGPSIAPTAGARVPRSLAGANIPTTNLRAPSSTAADRVDAITLAPIEANAAAGEMQRQANAPVAPQTAQPGQSQVDIGPRRIAANVGQRQPAGGGQPQVVPGMVDAPARRSRVGGTPRPSLTVSESAQLVASPPNRERKDNHQGAGASVLPIDRQSVAASASASPRPDPTADATSVSDAAARSAAGGRPTRSRGTESEIAEVATPGGGTLQRLRTTSAQPIPIATPAAQVRIVGQAESGGLPDAVPLQTQAPRAWRSTTGVYGPASNDPAGAQTDDVVREGVQGAVPAVSIARRAGSASDQVGPALADPLQIGNTAPRARAARRPSGVEAVVEVDVPLAGSLADRENLPSTEIAQAVQPGDVDRNQAGGLVVPIDALESLGGLASDQAPDVGVISRQAQPDSQLVADSRARFLRRNVGGPLSVDTRVAVPTDAFQTRFNRRGEDPAGGNGRPSQRTEEAIELGLVYLTRQQSPDGRWSLRRAAVGTGEVEIPSMHSDTAATGLALLSYLGAGYDHRSDKYQDVVKEGLEFLIDAQKEDGDLYLAEDEDSARSAWLYSHGIATIALCEAYGMTQDPQLREPAQKAVDFIVNAQHPQRGGWRYAPGVGSDTSVSGWMVMAMRSAELANLEVPLSAWTLVDRWLDMAQASDRRRELYRYNPLAPNTFEQSHGRQPSRTMTAVGLLMRLYTGWRRDNQNLVMGAEYLRSQLPEIGTLRNPQRDTYYWYYATQVMFHMRGEYWDAWNRRLHPMLTSSQIPTGSLAGSWDPQQPIPDRWADHGGRLYVTTLNLLSLEVYYRHLPIYEDTAR